MKPAAMRSSIRGSQLRGWRPVRRTMRGSRGTQASGVSASFASTAVAGTCSSWQMRGRRGGAVQGKRGHGRVGGPGGARPLRPVLGPRLGGHMGGPGASSGAAHRLWAPCSCEQLSRFVCFKRLRLRGDFRRAPAGSAAQGAAGAVLTHSLLPGTSGGSGGALPCVCASDSTALTVILSRAEGRSAACWNGTVRRSRERA